MKERVLRSARSTSSVARVIRGSAAYALAAVAQRSAGLLLLPLYTRVLDPTEYGQVTLILTITAGISTVVSLGLETAVFRSYVRLSANPKEQRNFVNSVGLLGLTAPIILTLVLALTLAPSLARGLDVPDDSLVIALIAAAMQMSVIVVPMALLRAQERLGDYLRLTGLQAICTTVFSLIFVVALDWGVRGWFLALLASFAIVLPFGLAVLAHQWHFTIQRAYIAGALAFGLPLLPHALAHWGLSLSDRVILGAYLPTSDVGLYFVAYQFGLPLGTLAMAMHQGVMPLYAQAADSDQRLSELGEVATHQVFITALLGLTAAVVGPPIIRLVLPAEYSDAAAFVPWISLGYTLYGLYLIPMDAVSLIAGKTRWVWLATVPAAVVNIILNLLTVPQFGPIAAAINTAVGYGVLLIAIYTYMHAVSHRRPRLQWRRIGVGLALVAVSAATVTLIGPSQPAAVAFLLGCSTVAGVAAALLLTGTWRVTRRNSAVEPQLTQQP